MTTSASTVSSASVTTISKYRVHVRDLGVAAGFKVSQVSTMVDLLTKGSGATAETISISYQANKVGEASWTKGKALVQETKGQQAGKLQRIQGWLAGQTKISQEELVKVWNLSPKVKEALEVRAAQEIKVLAKV